MHRYRDEMIARATKRRAVEQLLRQFPVVGILGVRQCGKTTLAGQVAAARRGATERFDLENPIDRERLSDPMLTLAPLRGLVILDEIQRMPDLFPVLRVLADRKPVRTRFLVLGSASPDLLRQSSESLAGRIAYMELEGFTLLEIPPKQNGRLWLRGGLPPSFLARTNQESLTWRKSYIRTFLERDLPQLGVRTPSVTLERFWTMLAHYHGQTWNASEFARSFGVSDQSVRRYLDLLTSTFVVRQLQPWVANLKKRQVKSPKIYLRDTGLLHSLLRIESRHDLERHPRLGASWEGFALQNVLEVFRSDPRDCFFWATQRGAELDLLIRRGTRLLGFEFKRSSAPSLTKSMRVAFEDLSLKSLVVVHAGKHRYPLASGIEAVPLNQITELS